MSYKCLVCDKPIDNDMARFVSAQYCSPACKESHVQVNLDSIEDTINTESEWVLVNNINNMTVAKGNTMIDLPKGKNNCTLYVNSAIADSYLNCGYQIVKIDLAKFGYKPQDAEDTVKISHAKDAFNFLLDYDYDWVLVAKDTKYFVEAGSRQKEIPELTNNSYTLYYNSKLGTPNTKVSYELVAVSLDISSITNQAVKGETGADTIKARESVYGPFEVHAEAEQDILEAVQKQPGWAKLNKVQKSAMQMIVHKMARILNSSADYDDNWHDISGYATLAEKDIKNRKSVKPD